MKRILPVFFALMCYALTISAQREIILNTTGYGFDRNASNGIHTNQWDRIQKFATLTYNGQDASVTAVRFHIQWQQYEPTLGNYYGAKLVQAVQAILASKPGMKIALHFPFQRDGKWNDGDYFADEDIARTSAGELVQENVPFTCPSIYSDYAKQRFYAFVDNALSQLTSYYSNILYVTMGNSQTEEYCIPYLWRNNAPAPGFYEDKALQKWRTEYLPCRYPGQSTVTWGGNTYNISSAPSFAPSTWDNWNSDHAREYQRFASWGLWKFFKGFMDVVKNRNSSIKVLYTVSDFGGNQANTQHLHGASLVKAYQESDGIYTSDGDQDINYVKIRALDVMKGTNPNKIAAVEFDPNDLGQQPGSEDIWGGVALEWMPRAYKHGANFVHLAMHYHDAAVNSLAPTLALIRSSYVNGSYTPPARQAATTSNIVPSVFQGASAFQQVWQNLGGSNWSTTDNNPVSVNMIDDGYWENIWSCSSTPPDPCVFTVSASASNTNPQPGTSVTLNSSCSGQCTGVSYSWSGHGITGSNASVTFNVSSTPGTYTYTVTASKSGCSPNKTATIQVTVPESGGGGNPCGYVDKQTVGTWSGLNVQTRSYTVNGSTAWLIVTAISGSSTDKHFPRGNNFADRGDISWTNGVINKTCLGGGATGYDGLVIPSGITVPSGYTQGTEQDGAVYFQQSCTAPSAPTVSASPTTITSGSNATLTASGCSGGTITWSSGLGTGTSKVVSPTTTTTYSATCTIGGCTSSAANVTVTVPPPSGGPNCNTLLSDVNGANCLFIEGWVYDQSNPNATVGVDIYEGSTLILSNVPANKFRQDLLNAGFGNGEHGLEVSTPSSLRDGNSHVLTFKVHGCSSYTMNSSPKTLSGCSNAVLDAEDASNASLANRKLQLFVSPNPSKGIFETSFYLEKGKKATIIVSDLQGRTIYKQTLTGEGQHKQKINLLNKASGTLLLQLHRDSGVETKKISIAR